METGVFDALVTAQHPLCIAELAEKSGVNIDLLSAYLLLLRVLNEEADIFQRGCCDITRLLISYLKPATTPSSRLTRLEL